MYLTHQGQGAFWPAGEIRVRGGGPVRSRWTRREPERAAARLGVRRQVWLGTLAATRPGPAAGPPAPTPAGATWTTYTFQHESAGTAIASVVQVDGAMAHANPSAERAHDGAGGRAASRRRSCSSAAPGAAARTCSPGCWAATRISRWSRSRSASTSRSAAFRACWRAHVSQGRVRAPPARLLVEGLSDRAACAGCSGSSPSERFEQAVAAFEAALRRRSRGGLPPALLRPALVPGRARPSAERLVEQSCDTIAQAPTLARLFPEAKFIHVVRDGRDASASRVAQTARPDLPADPTQGLEWWEERIRRDRRGARAIPPDRLLTVSLDELLMLGPTGAAAAVPVPGVYPERRCGASSAAG